MEDPDIPDYEFFEQLVVDEYNEIIMHVKHVISTDLHTSADLLKRVSHPPVLRVVAESHTGKPGKHVYKIELLDPRYFSKPIVFEILLDNNGNIITPE